MFKRVKPKVSVCIPVCGTEEYLLSCLESVSKNCNADFIVEIIVVDDSGLENKSISSINVEQKLSAKQIAKEFKKNHKKQKIGVKFIEHEKNKGLVEARRTALYESSGEYIMFLDSDDTLPENAVWLLLNAAEKTGADIVQGKANIVATSAQCPQKRIDDMENKANNVFQGELSGRDIFDGFLIEGNHSGFLWGKIFARELCFSAFTEIPPVYCIFGEDFLTYFFISYFAEKYVGIENIVYNYSVNTGISSNKKITDLEEWQKVCSTSSVFTILFNWIEEQSDEEKQGRCGVSPLEGVASNEVRARGRLSPLNESEIEKVRAMCRWYAANNVAQLKKAVAPEIQDEARKMLCEWWGKEMIEKVENL